MAGPTLLNDTLNLSATVVVPTVWKASGPTSYHYDIVRSIRFYSLIVVISVGIISNTLALIVFSCSYMRKTTSGIYFIFLSVADTFLLSGELLLWLNSYNSQGPVLGVDFMNTVDVWCKLIYFVRYTGRIWSSWLVVIITVARYLSIAFPLKVAQFSGPRTAVVVCVIELLVSCLVCTSPFFTLGVYPYKANLRCLITDHTLYKWFGWVVIKLGELILPSVIVSIFTALILKKLTKATQRRKQLSQGQRQMLARSSESQLTVTLLGIAITFVFVRLPYSITYYINEYKEEMWKPLNKWTSFYIYAANAIAMVLAVTNYSINFFLYCFCGSSFRNEFWRVMRCRSRSHKPYGSCSPSSRNHLMETVVPSYSGASPRALNRLQRDKSNSHSPASHR